MASDASQIVAQLLAKRERWVDLEDGKRLRIRRPPETDLGRFRSGLAVADVASAVVGWDGITEADILGPQDGSTSAVPFNAELCLEVLRDRIDWTGKAAEGVLDAIRQHLDAREAARKN
jgi:hypothetical protein